MVSVLVNGADGTAWPWLDGGLHVLRAFVARGAAAGGVLGWVGRWWSTGTATDLLPMGEKMRLARDRAGTVVEFWIVGTRFVPEAVDAADLRALRSDAGPLGDRAGPLK